MRITFIKTTIIFALIALIIYLFVSAPPPLLSEEDNAGVMLPTKEVLSIANEVNRSVRALYTREIVQTGKKLGLSFDEHWRDKDVIAGPLPAQFLRETAVYLEKSPVRLGLYLGSDFPINKANLISGLQMEFYAKIKQARQDYFFRVADTHQYVYMSPDIAVANACVDCHNKHINSPKHDWQLNDLMGATTWTYPTDKIPLAKAVILLQELDNGIRHSYENFLVEMRQLSNAPQPGGKWPKQGYFVPDLDTFMQEVRTRTASRSLAKLMQLVQTRGTNTPGEKE